MPSDLLFEIGCEEIPAKMLARALADLPALVDGKLSAARLVHDGARALGTPRRVAVIVHGLAERQPDLNEEVVGPPVSAAFAADGSVTKAGLGFASKNGVAPESLQKREVPGKKGQYVVATRSAKGLDVRELLPALLAEIAAAIPWPKSQRWGWSEITFVRPVQWLVALYGGEEVPLTWAGARSSRASRGHRFLANRAVEILDASTYVAALADAHVLVDPEVRKTRVREELLRLERETGARVRPDETLLAEVIHLGEWPVGVSGQFDASFLEVPEEMIVTAMRNHQRYFAMETADGALANRFATMMATIVKDPAVVAQGNEKVIASRLSDAKFFFAEDKKHSFDDWNGKLDAVVFQAKLGERAKTIGQKVNRLQTIVRMFASRAECDRAAAVRIAQLCKADLASAAVGEFPELQGTMGKHYARHAGEPALVADGIEQHYWPKGQGGELPRTPEAALVAIADRLDTLVGCFATDLAPTGSADPLGLRRAAIGVLAILLDRGAKGAQFPEDLEVLVEMVSNAYMGALNIGASRTALLEFLRTRLRGLFVDLGIPATDADAALAQDFRRPADAKQRALACAQISKESRAVFKRVANILDDARGKGLAIRPSIDQALLATDVEKGLHTAIVHARELAQKAHAAGDYHTMANSLAALQPAVAAFFDKGGVMVMDPDPALRDNRLALLEELLRHYRPIADFRLLGGGS